MRNQKTQSNRHYESILILAIATFISFTSPFEITSAAEGIWAQKRDMPTPRYAMATAVINGKIYTIGGNKGPGPGGDSTLEVYDPAADTWTRKADMPTPRCFLSASVVNGKIYAIGGSRVESTDVPSLATVEEYDPESDTWTRRADMPTQRAGLRTMVVDGIIYAIGGLKAITRAVVPTVEAYDPEMDTWTRKTNMPIQKCFMSANVVAGKIYILGGGIGWGGDPISTVEVYDPMTDNWTRKASMPVTKFGHASSAVGKMVFTIGGQYTVRNTGNTSVEAYDTVADAWTTFAHMPTARENLATAMVDGKIYALGGRFTHPGTRALGAVEEFNPFPLMVDFNGDGIVGIQDLILLIDAWGQAEPTLDIAPRPLGDGVVNAADLELLMDHWETEVDDPTLMACWKLDETEGDIAYDSAAVNDAMVIGDALWQPDAGKVDGALQFDGIDDYIETPFELNPADGEFSVFVWISGSAPGQVIISQENGVNWLMADAEEGALRTDVSDPVMETRRGSEGGDPLISQTMITDGDWHRVGFVWDGQNRILYADDVEVARDTLTNLNGSEGDLHIGAGSHLEQNTFWSGMVDDVRIYGRVVEP